MKRIHLLVAAMVMAFLFDNLTIAQKNQTTAFVNVQVIPMDTERVLENQTVVIQDGIIKEIGHSEEVAIPEGGEVIDGNGQYLMPGLADMHMHFTATRRTFEGPDQLPLFLAEGVTTVRNLSGLPKELPWREEVTKGERVGPTIYTSGRIIVGLPEELQSMHYTFRAIVTLSPVLIGLLCWLLLWVVFKLVGKQAEFSQIKRYLMPSLVVLLLTGGLLAWLHIIPLDVYTSKSFPHAQVVENAAEARQAVRLQKAAGYDFVKPYDWLGEKVYLAILDEAKQQNMYTVGHLLDELSPEEIFKGGLREVAHIDEFMEAHMIGEASPNEGFEEVTFDYASIPQTVAAAKAHDMMVVSNMVTDEVIYQLLADPKNGLAQPQYAVVPPDIINTWLTEGRLVNWQGQHDWRRNVQMPFFKTLCKVLHDAGVPLMIGTDMTVEGMVPSHIHRELELLVETGLTPFEALEAGTKNAGMSVKRMGKDGNFGTIAIGQRSDLILLEENPLENVSYTRNRIGVMVRGKYFTQSELDQLVGEYIATY